jgi:flavin-dependent dehydrogenase
MNLAATLPLEQAACRTWDAVVIGAGPAGALAARELARLGVAVLLADRASFPRWKVCGCCLNRWALESLQTVGLGELPERCGAVPLRQLQLSARGAQALLPLPEGAVLSRERLDMELAAAAIAAGAAFLPQTRAVLPGALEEGRRVLLRQGERSAETSARVVLVAAGLSGMMVGEQATRADSRIGAGAVLAEAPASYRPGVISMACGAKGYAGLVRLEDGRLDVAAALDPRGVREAGGLGGAVADILAEAGLPPIPNLEGQSWRGTPLLTRRRSRVAAARLFLLGDAAGYIEPFTGEGIAWALASGLALAPLAARASRSWSPTFAAEWTAMHRRLIIRRQQLCRVVTQALRCPVLVHLVVRLLAHLPALAGPVVHRLNQMPQPLGARASARRPLLAGARALTDLSDHVHGVISQ